MVYAPLPSEGHSWFMCLLRGLFRLIVILTVWILALLAIGIPGEWIPRRWYNPPEQPFAPQVGRIRFNLMRGWTLENVVLYVRGWAGPPLARFESLSLDWKPGAWWAQGWGIDTISVRHGTIVIPASYATIAPQATLPAPIRWEGRIRVDHLDLWGQTIRRAEGRLRISDRVVRWDEMIVECEGKAGELATLRGAAEVDFSSSSFHGRFQWHGNPMAIAPFMELVHATRAVYVFQRFCWGTSWPTGEAEFEGKFWPSWNIRFLTTAEGRDGEWDRFPFEQFFLRLRYQGEKAGDRMIRFDPLVWLTGQAAATAHVEVSLPEKRVRADGFFSGDPTSVLAAFPAVAEAITNRVHFEGPVRVQGSVDWKGRSGGGLSTDLSFGMEKVVWRGMAFDRVVGRWQGEGSSGRIPEFQADTFGGVITGSMTVALAPGETNNASGSFTLQGVVSGLDLREAAQEFRPGWAARNMGELSGRFILHGRLVSDWPQTLVGEGTIRIREGKLFRFPLFGSLTDWIARLVPGLDIKLSQTEAEADWRIASGCVRTDNLWINGEWISVSARGAWEFSDELDGYAQIKLLKAESLIGKTIRTLTYPISKLFEFRIRGPLSKPRWYPANFSADLFERLSGRGESSDSPASGGGEAGSS